MNKNKELKPQKKSQNRCGDCKDGENKESMESKSMENLMIISTRMSCGCGGEVTHGIYRCKSCDKYYLTEYQDHWEGSDYFIDLIDKKNAEENIKELKKCKNLGDDRCNCDIHTKSESMRQNVNGKTKYSKPNK